MRAATQWGASGAVFESATRPWSGEAARSWVSQRRHGLRWQRWVRTSQRGPHGAAPTPDGECARATVPCPSRRPERLPVRPGQSCLKAKAWGPYPVTHCAALRCSGDEDQEEPGSRPVPLLYFSYFSQFALCELTISVCTLPSRPRSWKCGFVLLKKQNTNRIKTRNPPKCNRKSTKLGPQYCRWWKERPNWFFENGNITSF